MTQAPYYDIGDGEQAARCSEVGHHLRATLAAPLRAAAMEQLRGHWRNRQRLVTQIVEELVAIGDPYLLAEMLVVDAWDTAMAHARSDVRHVEREFAQITKRLGSPHVCPAPRLHQKEAWAQDPGSADDPGVCPLAECGGLIVPERRTT